MKKIEVNVKINKKNKKEKLTIYNSFFTFSVKLYFTLNF